MTAEDRWYDLNENQDCHPKDKSENSPPPIPARSAVLRNSNLNSSSSVPGTPSKGFNHVNNFTTPNNTNNAIRREFFHRSAPHHGSFHTKLSSSRSHDMLHFKNGLNMRPIPFNLDEDENLYDVRQNATLHAKLTRDHSSLGFSSNGVGVKNDVYGSSGLPYIDSGFGPRGKMTTYLTDFPLTHSHSTEHIMARNKSFSSNNGSHFKVM